MTRIMHIIDSLDAGGAERVAVNLTNGLSNIGHEVTLCATRKGGILQETLLPSVNYFNLRKKSLFDLASTRLLIHSLKENNIQIIHAHSSSAYIIFLTKLFLPRIKNIWHIHFGGIVDDKKKLFLYRLLLKFIDGIVVVSSEQAEWVKETLGYSTDKCLKLPNFITEHKVQSPTNLPGVAGSRIVCVANLRPIKDHFTLIRTMRLVVDKVESAHLILIGGESTPNYHNSLITIINELGLHNHITWFGQRSDVTSILSGCDVGVLSSTNEGLPVALLEYGAAGLGVVVTDVGECRQVLQNGAYGFLVVPKDPDALAAPIIKLLQNPLLRKELGIKLKSHIQETYDSGVLIQSLDRFYDEVLSSKNAHD